MEKVRRRCPKTCAHVNNLHTSLRSAEQSYPKDVSPVYEQRSRKRRGQISCNGTLANLPPHPGEPRFNLQAAVYQATQEPRSCDHVYKTPDTELCFLRIFLTNLKNNSNHDTLFRRKVRAGRQRRSLSRCHLNGQGQVW